MSYEVEIIERKDLTNHLEASKSSIKDMLSDLLNETKGFKYQITLKVTLKKYKPNKEIEFRPVYFNWKTKTVINHNFRLGNAFQEILYMLDNWTDDSTGVVCSVLAVKMSWQNIKEVFLSVNDAQSLRLEKETIELKDYFKQIPVPFKIYADFEWNLEGVEIYEGFY